MVVSCRTIEMEVGADSEAIGKTLKEVRLPRSVMVAGIIRGGESFIPHGDTEIMIDDDLILITLPDAVHAVERVFG